MAAVMVKIKCLTNMHVGNGDVNYNIIDNEVEKDPTTGYPVINSSGVKGALRAFLADDENCVAWFGPKHDDSSSVKAGELKILGAEMLAIPMRASKGGKAYYMVTTETAVKRYNSQVEVFGVGEKIVEKPVNGLDKIGVEGYSVNKAWTISDIPEVYQISDSDMSTYSLPVMARNCLENGESKNLWYEEIVPHESIFYFPVISENGRLLDDFVKKINGTVIQFGGNASIGYGLCKVTVER